MTRIHCRYGTWLFCQHVWSGVARLSGIHVCVLHAIFEGQYSEGLPLCRVCTYIYASGHTSQASVMTITSWLSYIFPEATGKLQGDF